MSAVCLRLPGVARRAGPGAQPAPLCLRVPGAVLRVLGVLFLAATVLLAGRRAWIMAVVAAACAYHVYATEGRLLASTWRRGDPGAICSCWAVRTARAGPGQRALLAGNDSAGWSCWPKMAPGPGRALRTRLLARREPELHRRTVPALRLLLLRASARAWFRRGASGITSPTCCSFRRSRACSTCRLRRWRPAGVSAWETLRRGFAAVGWAAVKIPVVLFLEQRRPARLGLRTRLRRAARRAAHWNSGLACWWCTFTGRCSSA